MYEDTVADYEQYEFHKLLPYNEHDNEDMKKAVLELNKEGEDELADLVNIKVPEVNKT